MVSITLAMTGPQVLVQQNEPAREPSHYKCFSAMNNKHGVRQDMEALCKFVRETLFYTMIHDARGSTANPNDEVMGENGKACQIFVHVFLRDKEKISNIELIDSTTEEKEYYLKFLWREGLRARGKYNIRKALSNEKSAVYAGISESFKSKYMPMDAIPMFNCKTDIRPDVSFLKELVHDCSVNNVPFPALETFEDRKMFPKRYFIFFDLFVRAGRHNRDLWRRAIRDCKGQNCVRFGPAIFEAHVRTTVCKNYFKWIFQQLSDIHEVEDKDVEDFKMEYDEDIYSNLPRVLVCTHKELTKFPFKSYEIEYADVTTVSTHNRTEEDDDDSYCSANSVDRAAVTGSPNNPAADDSQQEKLEKKFFLVYKNANDKRFTEIRDQQRNDMKSIIEKTKGQYKDILESLKDSIRKIREVKKTMVETDPMYKAAIADTKKKLRLFKDPYEEDIEGPVRKKRRRSIENKTRFSDSKVTYFSKANEDMKRKEEQGVRKSWDSLYKEIWNEHLLVVRNPVIDVPFPK